MFVPLVRVATWNLLDSAQQRGERLTQLASLIRDVDVLAIQEVCLSGSGGNVAEDLADRVGFPHAHWTPAGYPHEQTGDETGTAVISRLPVLATHELPMPWTVSAEAHKPAHHAYAALTVEMPSGRTMVVASAHLPWGGDQENARFAYAEAMDAHLASLTTGREGAIAVLAGDLNTLPSSDTVRYLTGLARGVSTKGAYFVDAWATANPGEHGYTQDPRSGNWNIDQVARASGILDPGMLPPRRIDYVLVRGWAHGRAGYPLAARLLGKDDYPRGALQPSDHYGVLAELWDPEP